MTTRADWRAWLEVHHGQRESIWLVTPRKGAGPDWLSNDDIVEEALCFGWIDSLPRKLDERRTMLLLSPRKAGSNWSAVNKARVERMVAAGSMRPAGQAAIDAAKTDGSWSRLDAVDRLEMPPELAAALGIHRAVWDGWPASLRRGLLERLVNAKLSATRARLVAGFAESAARGERPAMAARAGGRGKTA